MASVMVHPLPECTIRKGDLAEDSVFASSLNTFWHCGGPLRIEPARSVCRTPNPRAFEKPHLAECALRVAEVVLQNVSVVDARVERDRSAELHVSPGGDDDAVASADLRVHDELRTADRSVVDQGANEAVDRIAPKVLSD